MEVSREGKAYIKKRESLKGTDPDRSWLPGWSWSLTFLALHLACACHLWILTDLSIWATMRQVRGHVARSNVKKAATSLMLQNTWFRAISTLHASLVQSNANEICTHYSLYNYTSTNTAVTKRSSLRSANNDGFVRFLPSNSTATKRQSSHSNAKCTPGSPNTMAQRTESCKDHLRTALTMGATCAPSERKPGASRKRGFPYRRRGPFYARKHGILCDFERPNITLTQQSQLICNHRLANHNRATSTKAANIT